MKVCIVGAGSIGAVMGARLAGSGHTVSLVARGAHLEAIRQHGLKLVDHIGDDSAVYELRASDDPADLGPQDLVVIGLKAHAIASMLPRMQPLIARDTVVLPAINGLPWWYFYKEAGAMEGRSLRALDPQGEMFTALDPAHVLGCVVHIAAEVRGPGEVHHTGGRRMVVGEPAGGVSARMTQVADALDAAGFETTRSARIRMDIWIKLIGNLSFNPVAALTGLLMDRICADEGLIDLIRSIMAEGMAVARHYGYELPISIEQRIDIARSLGAAKVSMHQDMEQRRPLELAAIVGTVLELAAAAGIDVPASRHVYSLTLARARALGIS